MRFGPWHPIDGAATTAPDRPGVLQARAEGLLSYPSGRSAMVLYAAAAGSLRTFVATDGAPLLDRARAAGASWVRFAESDAPLPACARLLSHFTERFGAPPCANG